jgi:hypothetical protein
VNRTVTTIVLVALAVVVAAVLWVQARPQPPTYTYPSVAAETDCRVLAERRVEYRDAWRVELARHRQTRSVASAARRDANRDGMLDVARRQEQLGCE